MSSNPDTPTTRVCAIYRTPLGCYENLIRSDLFIYPSGRSADIILQHCLKIFASWCQNDFFSTNLIKSKNIRITVTNQPLAS